MAGDDSHDPERQVRTAQISQHIRKQLEKLRGRLAEKAKQGASPIDLVKADRQKDQS